MKIIKSIFLGLLAFGAILFPTTTFGGLTIVTSTNLIADWVQNLALPGSTIRSIMPAGADPHSFEFLAQDAITLQGADLVFAHGLGFEGNFSKLLEVNCKIPVIFLSETIPQEKLILENTCCKHTHFDPHTWLDPHNVIYMLQAIHSKLCEVDPKNKETYNANLLLFVEKIKTLDARLLELFSAIPIQERKLITEHNNLSYFANRYQLTIIDNIYKTNSSESAEPSAHEFSKLIETINKNNIFCISCDKNSTSSLPQALSRAAHIPPPIYLCTESLSGPPPYNSYISLMEANTKAICSALQTNNNTQHASTLQ